MSCLGSIFAIIDLERGIPSKRKSSACADYVPALCTHRPSLLPILSDPVNLLDCEGSKPFAGS
jgi:hypothetical protein